MDNIDEVSELSEEAEEEEEVKTQSKKKTTTGKRLTKYEREKRQLEYAHEKDDNDYTDFRVGDPPKSGDEMFDTEGKY